MCRLAALTGTGIHSEGVCVEASLVAPPFPFQPPLIPYFCPPEQRGLICICRRMSDRRWRPCGFINAQAHKHSLQPVRLCFLHKQKPGVLCPCRSCIASVYQVSDLAKAEEKERKQGQVLRSHWRISSCHQRQSQAFNVYKYEECSLSLLFWVFVCSFVFQFFEALRG